MKQEFDLSKLEQTIHYTFRDAALLQRAMTHSSYINEHHLQKMDCNERLEFLGDAVLEIVSSEFLYFKYPKEPEGQLTRLRASMVCEPTLDFCARAFGLQNYLILGRGEETTGGRNRASLVSDALEALIGAIYLDGGFASAKEFILQFVLNDLEHKKLFFDSKTILQEMVQKEDGSGHLNYVLVGETGPDHEKEFHVQVCVDETVMGEGVGHTKKTAEQKAAYQAILRIQKEQE
jgi:ribonuclease-3